ncbi:MAG: hypothetical protein JWN65_2802 [Solirubrobacterales bacterium]|jgi:hypothetical protein|nr:hypothetical protein [Solirubrobacterales bacterium]
MDEAPAHEQRAARNEAAFRRLNENLAEELPDTGPYRAGFVCECSAADCRRLVDLTVTEYQAVREHPMHFLVVPGHERTDVEDVVGAHDGYLVVQKHPDLASAVDSV